MQVKTVVLSLFVAVAAARSIDEIVADIPSCAKPCIDSASTKAGCAIADHNCQCNKIGELTSDSVVCVSQGCDAGDISKTSQVTTELCLAVAQQVGDSTFSSVIQSLSSGVGSAFTSATDAAGSALTSATGAAGSAFSSATSAAGSANPSPTHTPDAANHAAAGMGMVGAAAIFALVL